MDGLILLVILIPIIFLILLLVILNNTSEQKRQLESLSNKLKDLNKQVHELTTELREQKTDTSVKPLWKEYLEKNTAPQPAKEEIKPFEEKKKEETPVPEPPKILVTPPEKEPGESFAIPKLIEEQRKKEANTDLEKFIGENLANKIGIAILVLGIAFFVKYAIDKNWINEAGRVIIGLISGGILIGLAHYFRNSYRSFSSVLVGGGLSVFYFSVAFAFHQYHLIGQTAAFTIMVVIAGLGVFLSLFYNRQELAILATIGGFITPFLVSTGQENYIALFTYIGILNTGLMVLAWFKRWPAINSIALFFTVFIYSGWLIKRTVWEDPSTLKYSDAFLFATLFYIQFVVMNIVNTIRLKDKFSAYDFIILLSVNFLYYVAGMIIMNYWTDNRYDGLFTVALGIFNLLLTLVFLRKKNIDKNFTGLLMGLALTFISLTAAIQLKANHVTIFWAAEAVILYWLYQRTSFRILKWASLIVMAGMLLSLSLNWVNIYIIESSHTQVLIHAGFITGIIASAALFIFYSLIQGKKDEPHYASAKETSLRNRILFIAIFTAYLSGLFEIIYQFTEYYPEAPVYTLYVQAYSFAVVILVLQLLKKTPQLPMLKLLLTALSLGYYIFSLNSAYDASVHLINAGKTGAFLIHWLAAALLLWLLYDLVLFFFRSSNTQWQEYRTGFTWIAATGIIVVLSAELYHAMLWLHYEDETDWVWWKNLYFKAGLSIMWGLCSFAMMWIGMKKNFRVLRIISLTLFTITLVKLFLYDIRNIPPGGKIAAFILLGILLLAISFMYQRLKKIIIDNVPE